MKKVDRLTLGCILAAALLLQGCWGRDSGSGSSSGSSTEGSTQSGAWRTGLGVVNSAEATERAGTITTTAAAVLLDADGRLADVMLDELETSISADNAGTVSMPSDYRTKRQMGEDYPLAAVSSIKKSWAEQADAFADYLTGKTPDEVKALKTDEDGKGTDADLLSGCTIAVEPYREAILRACENAKALGAAQGDRITLGIEAGNGTAGLTGSGNKEVQAQVDTTLAVVTMDEDARVTSAIIDMTEPAVTVGADGTVTPPESVRTKLEQGDDYGMRNASGLKKEWYEQSEGYCDYLKGKNVTEVGKIPADGSDADLLALCTISTQSLHKAVLKAMKAE